MATAADALKCPSLEPESQPTVPGTPRACASWAAQAGVSAHGCSVQQPFARAVQAPHPFKCHPRNPSLGREGPSEKVQGLRIDAADSITSAAGVLRAPCLCQGKQAHPSLHPPAIPKPGSAEKMSRGSGRTGQAYSVSQPGDSVSTLANYRLWRS